MQIVISGDNLHEMSKPIFWEKILDICQIVCEISSEGVKFTQRYTFSFKY